MNINFVPQSATIETPAEWIAMYPKLLEQYGRTCYKSEHNITEDSAEPFIRRLIKSGHESVLEHCSITARIVCDRATSHQVVRHRLCSFSQESQRYCGYKDRFTFIPPETFLEYDSADSIATADALGQCCESYIRLRENGVKKEVARAVLPNCMATELVMTANLRQWRHVFAMRCDKHAQKPIRAIMKGLLRKMSIDLPCVFDDLTEKYHG